VQSARLFVSPCLRLSKEGNGGLKYLSGMETNVDIQGNWTVDTILSRKPGIVPVFFRNRMQCVGCYMQKFCTIKDAAEIYQLDLNTLLKDLNNFTPKEQDFKREK
jgi:hybrid cluster-associated redox disulfide protein